MSSAASKAEKRIPGPKLIDGVACVKIEWIIDRCVNARPKKCRREDVYRAIEVKRFSLVKPTPGRGSPKWYVQAEVEAWINDGCKTTDPLAVAPVSVAVIEAPTIYNREEVRQILGISEASLARVSLSPQFSISDLAAIVRQWHGLPVYWWIEPRTGDWQGYSGWFLFGHELGGEVRKGDVDLDVASRIIGAFYFPDLNQPYLPYGNADSGPLDLDDWSATRSRILTIISTLG
ncbi:MAG: hypothetical protein JSS66_00090 [Armatimonadetes bacterium]|nr:hypothetical protein [Armatimonadota bacterium]